MKKIGFLLISTLAFGALRAQDSTGIQYRQELDSLPKQRFLDRYENVFMTKVPTRHMLKVGVASDYLNFVGQNFLKLGYEYKLSPSFSVGADAFLSASWGGHIGLRRTTTIQPQVRWYYDMKKRIQEGKSANNFSGNYLGVFYQYIHYHNVLQDHQRLGIEYGIQRRFLNRGVVDFAIGVVRQRESWDLRNPDGTRRDIIDQMDYALGTRRSIRLAFGDWKKTKQSPLCEVLRCDELVRSQLKIAWPNLYLGLRGQQLNGSIAYEQKLGSAPWSVNAQINGQFDRSSRLFTFHDEMPYLQWQVQPTLQLRHYFLQKRKIQRGTGAPNLSGPYLGLHTEYFYSQNPYQDTKVLGLGGVVGIQQRLFKNAYIDLSISRGQNLLKSQRGRPSHQTTFHLGVGLAF
ncbi:hypothetical protein GCM10027275_00740 [Rhabdobacter roseus]|uniref:Uncharacterized protein n=1 Tax=Rhabdobacter roseus TaxID=1655419 RepID=A0A840TPL0_9BACT|nr:DUF3575 domain-containing protein [Rhabdobacter roseus]MBB5281958.1 hypothetical protein [Rhabdobacter roseus]